jgi:uncharacterized protein YjbI with pentapeptide repeats
LRGADLAESITNCFTEPIYVTHRWRGACLIGAELSGAHLGDAEGPKASQLAGALIDGTTILSSSI